jgi:hypothetical protein
MVAHECPFCTLPAERIVRQSDLCHREIGFHAPARRGGAAAGLSRRRGLTQRFELLKARKLRFSAISPG